MKVAPEEFVSARDASRGLGKLIDRLEAGGKVVIVDRNKPRAVLVSFSEFENGLRAVEPREGMVTVYDSSGQYVGCMGEETWRRMVAQDEGKPLSVEERGFYGGREPPPHDQPGR